MTFSRFQSEIFNLTRQSTRFSFSLFFYVSCLLCLLFLSLLFSFFVLLFFFVFPSFVYFLLFDFSVPIGRPAERMHAK